jgi:hypothetical protein
MHGLEIVRIRTVRCATAALCLLLATSQVNAEESEPKNISLIRLIVDPAAYDGMRVRTKGFVVVGREESAICISADSADFVMTEDALWLDLSEAGVEPLEFNKRYVVVEGTVDGSPSGMWRLFPGAIRSVTKIRTLSRRDSESQ